MQKPPSSPTIRRNLSKKKSKEVAESPLQLGGLNFEEEKAESAKIKRGSLTHKLS